MHGDLNQNHRMNTLRKFKKGTINFLVATDAVSYTHLDVYKRQV